MNITMQSAPLSFKSKHKGSPLIWVQHAESAFSHKLIGRFYMKLNYYANMQVICQPYQANWAFDAFICCKIQTQSYNWHLTSTRKVITLITLSFYGTSLLRCHKRPVSALRQWQGKYPGSTEKALALQGEDKAVLFSTWYHIQSQSGSASARGIWG